MMYKPKRLHPIAIFIHTGKNIKRVLFSLIALVFFKHSEEGMIIVALVGTLLIFLFVIVFSFLSWLRYTYRMENDELRIEYGILFRKKRYIPLERIQTLDITEGILQQMFRLVKVQVETAGGGPSDDAEVVLSAISKQEVQLLQDFVASTKSTNDENEKTFQKNKVIYKITASELLLLSLTSGGVGVVISAVLASFSQLDRFIPYKKLFGRFEHLAQNSIITITVLVLFGLVLAWIAALIRTMLKYANFSVVKADKDLIISHGLLEKRQVTIPIKRIQSIRISENIIRQILGYATVHVESAGGSTANIEGSKVLLLPIIRLKGIADIIETNLQEYCITSTFNPVPKLALRRYILRSWYISIPIVIASLIFLKIWGLLSLILLGIMTVLAVLKYKSAGWNIHSQQLSFRYRGIIQTTIFIRKNKIQSIEVTESYFQASRNLGSIEALVKSGAGLSGGKVVDLGKEDIKKIYQWFSRIKKQGLHS